MSNLTGIIAFGGYVPQLRLRRSAISAANAWANTGSRGKGERAFANWDEDVVTMAVEASRDALVDRDRADVTALLLASTSAPFADRSNAGLVAAALGLDETVTTLDVGGTMRAGASALIAGAALAEAKGGTVIVAAGERRNSKPGSGPEQTNGDAAAAIVLGKEGVIANILATHSVSRDFVDHYRENGQKHDYGWEERWVRDEGYAKLVPIAVAGVLDKAGIGSQAVTRFILPTPLASVPPIIAKKLKLADGALTDSIADRMGFAGAAHGLVQLALVLETAKAGDRILIASFGNGCEAILLEVTAEIEKVRPRRGVSGWLAQGKSTDDYMRFLSFNGEIDVEWGPREEFGNKYALTTQYRYGADMLAFKGGRDKATGVIQFPKTPKSVAPGAVGVADYEDVAMAEVPAKVVSFTVDWLTFHPSPPFYFGLAQFDNGARILMEIVDVGEKTLAVGTELEMTFRIKEIDRVRGYRHYFWKATPKAQAAALAEAAE